MSLSCVPHSQQYHENIRSQTRTPTLEHRYIAIDDSAKRDTNDATDVLDCDQPTTFHVVVVTSGAPSGESSRRLSMLLASIARQSYDKSRVSIYLVVDSKQVDIENDASYRRIVDTLCGKTMIGRLESEVEITCLNEADYGPARMRYEGFRRVALAPGFSPNDVILSLDLSHLGLSDAYALCKLDRLYRRAASAYFRSEVRDFVSATERNLVDVAGSGRHGCWFTYVVFERTCRSMA